MLPELVADAALKARVVEFERGIGLAEVSAVRNQFRVFRFIAWGGMSVIFLPATLFVSPWFDLRCADARSSHSQYFLFCR